MKTRGGFVSNSSSSSFVVVRKGFLKKDKSLLTPKEEKLLVKYGFKKVGCYRADQVECEFYHDIKEEIRKRQRRINKKFKYKPCKTDNVLYNLGYAVTCNQDAVIYFLLKNNISFEGNCHYGDYNVVYKKGEKYFLILQNYGIQCRMNNDYKQILKESRSLKEKPVEKVNVANWLKNEEKWRKELDNESS